MTVLTSSLKQSICHFANTPVCPALRELWRWQWLKPVLTGENACYADLKSVIQNLCCYTRQPSGPHSNPRNHLCRCRYSTYTVSGEAPWTYHQDDREQKMVYCQSLLPKKIISSEAYDLGGKKSLNLVLREAPALTQSAVIAQRSHHRLLRAVFL